MSRPKSESDLARRASWQRWEMDSLESLKPRAPVVGASTADKAAKTDWLRQRAETLAEAREQGLAKGYEAGLEQGRREGHAQGHAQGLEEGHREGHEAGEREGRALGLRAGHDEGAEDAREQATRLRALVESCAQSVNSLEAEVGQALISLAVRIAEHVLRTKLQDHPQHILDLVGEILQNQPTSDSATQLRLHPDDVDLLREFLDQNPDSVGLRLIADERITRGGCVLETAQGALDATLETRWQRVIAALGHTPEQP